MRHSVGPQEQGGSRGAVRAEPHGAGLSDMGVVLALAGVAALGVIGVQALRRGPDMGIGVTGRAAGALPGVLAPEPEVERSITIERLADEIYQRWHDPTTLPTIMGHFAHVEVIGQDRSRWVARGPDGQSRSWAMREVENRPNEAVRWEAEDEAAVLREGVVRFRPALGKEGTVVTLRLRIHPPGGPLGQAAARFMHGIVPREIASKSLRYFKSLVLTGEIPTTDRQPAARRDTR